MGIISKIILENCKTWDEHISEALWAYCTAYKLTISYTPFQLTFGLDVVTSSEVKIPSLRLILPHNWDDSILLAE